MNSPTLWYVAGLLFVVAGIASLVSGTTTIALLLLAAGLLSLSVPSYNGRRRR